MVALYTFGEIFPDRVDLCLHLAVEPDEIVVLCEIFYVFVMGRVYCNGVDAEAKLSQIDFIQLLPDNMNPAIDNRAGYCIGDECNAKRSPKSICRPNHSLHVLW